jgi:hypothetical protein
MDSTRQITNLFLLAIPIACIAWTVTHEEFLKNHGSFVLTDPKPAAVYCNANFSISSPVSIVSAITSH